MKFYYRIVWWVILVYCHGNRILLEAKDKMRLSVGEVHCIIYAGTMERSSNSTASHLSPELNHFLNYCPRILGIYSNSRIIWSLVVIFIERLAFIFV